VARADTPPFTERWWPGFAEITKPTAHRHDIIGWHHITENPQPGRHHAAAILLGQPLPFEYPFKLGRLIDQLADAGLSREAFYLVLGFAALVHPDGEPLYVIVGTPMRGIRGGPAKQHLAVWRLAPDHVSSFASMLPRSSDSNELRAMRGQLADLVKEWARLAPVEWCTVREDRPEVTRDRAEGSPARSFAAKAVAVWGCGALGTHVAEHLARIGVRRLVLRDRGTVAPGVLLRQCFDDSDIGRNKAEALKDRLLRIRPGLEIQSRTANLLTDPALDADWTDSVDVVLDTTANTSATKRLELLRYRTPSEATIVARMIIGHTAEHGLVTYSPSFATAGPADLARRAKITASRDPCLKPFAEEFWPHPPRTDYFQPEPGCSEPTFTGSNMEISALAGSMLLSVGADLGLGTSHATATFALLPHAIPGRSGDPARIEFHDDVILEDQFCGYQVRLSSTALAEIRAWAQRARRVAPGHETGGVLFGERDDALGVLWVTDVLGPPPDSIASPEGFVCGTSGVDQAAAEIARRSRGASKPLGMWHTHPGADPIPSPRDHGGMRQLISDDARPLPKQLLLILGGTPDEPTLGAYVYDQDHPRPPLRQLVITRPSAPPAPAHAIGLAMSGGGFRAVAFHLGVMRALHDRGVLDHLSVISAVSGGSLLAAMWAYSDEPFGDFDQRVTELLRRGLTTDIAKALYLTRRAPQALGSTIVAGGARIGAAVATIAARSVARARRHVVFEPPARRWVTRTTALEDVLARQLFGDATVDRPRRDVKVVLNACELRSGTAFRFGSAESGSSRFGRLADNRVPVARAVAASAAYPVLLPALDRREEFIGWDGKPLRERVVLTDGGVYDNLGLTCLAPGRSPKYSTNVHPVDYIVSCDAGQGILDIDTWPMWWPSRVKRSFESTYRKAQDAGKRSLHEDRVSGKIKGFAMAFLGMNDRNLPIRPHDLVPRDQVVGYPTDFSPMTPENLDLLSQRGEQLTRLVVESHCPNIA
jgi:integrative and conjugative element protein (TIGR02256 family)